MKKDTSIKEKFLLKDHLFNLKKVSRIIKEIHAVYPVFKEKSFTKDVIEKFPTLELKERIVWIRKCLQRYLPKDYRDAVHIVLQSLPPPLNPHNTDNDFGDFIYAPYSDFVARYGLNKKDIRFSLNALKEITTRFSAEDAIRYFINTHPQETFALIDIWSKDANYHVRRLCSEGTRPKLPWSQKIHTEPSMSLAILDNLFYDKTRYVTRSVANHMNDLIKSHPDMVIKKLHAWKKSSEQNAEEMNFIIKHSLRTLIKKGNKDAFTLLGFSYAPELIVSNFTVPQKVLAGTALEFSFTIKPAKNTNVLIDYIISFQNKVGKMNSQKVFKIKKLSLKKDTPIVILKKHFFRENMTTRTLYKGIHKIAIQINGKVFLDKNFVLE